MTKSQLKQVDIQDLLDNLPEDPSGIGMCVGCQ